MGRQVKTFAAAISARKTVWLEHAQSVAAIMLLAANVVFLGRAIGAPLMEEPFNYAAGTDLAVNAPWAGVANGALGIVAGSLSLSNLQSIAPAGNQLQITGAGSASAYRNFSSSPVTGGAVYCSFLINCSVAPTNAQFTLALLEPGRNNATPPDDPLDLYLRPATGGYSFTIRGGGSDPATAGRVLAVNTTHLVVVKYTFGSIGESSVYMDPTPGAAEPLNPDASTSSDDDNTGASSLQVILFRASTAVAQGNWSFDTVRVGTNWADVTPLVAPLTLTGPDDQATCLGSPVAFNVTANGTPPYFYSWRTNGVPIPGATNSEFTLSSTAAADALNTYDVVVRDSFGATTSRVARLTLSSVPASIAIPPADQIVTPSSTNVFFTVTAAGDAPLAYQWRTNGIAIAGATNSTLTVTNPRVIDPNMLYDVIVSNPCGAVTSSPPASLIFPSVFYTAYDAGPGFFSGENLLLTNSGGLALQAWSSSSLSLPITQWNLEGPMQEQPLNDGTGRSFYSINVNPAASPVYYIFGTSVLPPYLNPIPVLTITTDPSGLYLVSVSRLAASNGGSLGLAAGPLTIAPAAGGGLLFSASGVPGNTYYLQAAATMQPPIQWLTLQTNVADANGLILFSDTNASASRFYRLSGQ